MNDHRAPSAAPPSVRVDSLQLRCSGAGMSPSQARAIGEAFAGHLAAALRGAAVGHGADHAGRARPANAAHPAHDAPVADVAVRELVLDIGSTAPSPAQLQRAAARVAEHIAQARRAD